MRLRVTSLLSVVAFLIAGCSTSNSVPATEVDAEAVEQVAVEPDSSSAPALPTPRWAPEASSKFDSPWPTDVTIDELINTALYRSNEFFGEVRVPNCVVPYRLHLGEPMLDVHKPMVEDLVLNTTELFCDYLNSELIVIGGNYDYVLEVMAENQYPGDDFGGVCGYPVENDYASACAYKGVAWIGINWGRMRGGEVFTEGRRITIAAHEIFHLIHDGLDPDAPALVHPREHLISDQFGTSRAAANFLEESLLATSSFIPMTGLRLPIGAELFLKSVIFPILNYWKLASKGHLGRRTTFPVSELWNIWSQAREWELCSRFGKTWVRG